MLVINELIYNLWIFLYLKSFIIILFYFLYYFFNEFAFFYLKKGGKYTFCRFTQK